MIEVIMEKYVQFNMPGSFYPEECIVKVDSYTIDGVQVPQYAYAYRFYSIEKKLVIVDGETFKKTSGRLNETGWFYINGEVLTLDDIPDDDEHRILRFNMRSNGYKYIVRCNMGNYQPFNSDDAIVRY